MVFPFTRHSNPPIESGECYDGERFAREWPYPDAYAVEPCHDGTETTRCVNR
jgi:hypothetical protein